MTNISKISTAVLLSAILIGSIAGISPTLMAGIANAHKPNPASPPECSPNVDQPKTGHFVSVVVSGSDATATAGVTEAGTGSNRVAFLLFDSAGTLVSGPVRVHRDAQPPSSWSVSHMFTGLAPGSYALVACFESPNNPNVPPVGVTHHVDSAKFRIVPAACNGVHDVCIDTDGAVTPTDGLPGAAEVTVGSVLTPFPTGSGVGLDWIKELGAVGGPGVWTPGDPFDNFMYEDPSACPTAIRNAVYDAGLDCKVLDPDGSLTGGELVFAGGGDLDGGSPDPHLKYFDTNSDGNYDPGEDIVFDGNLSGTFD